MPTVDTPSPEEEISRLTFAPAMFTSGEDLRWDVVFQFHDGLGESVVRHYFFDSEAHIHILGQNQARDRAQARGRPIDYKGYISSTIGVVCDIENANGNGFTVVPKIDEGIYHAHIEYKFATGVSYADLNKTEKAHLKELLRNVFGAVVPCPL